jgi:hypothetical protein
MPRVRIDRLIDNWEPTVRRAFLDSFKNVKDQSQIIQITKAIYENNIPAALDAVGLDPVNFRPLDRALASAYEAGGNATASGFPLLGQPGELRLRFQFDVRNPAAEQWINNYSSTLITDILDDQRNMIRNVLAEGLARGDNPRDTALGLIGELGPDGSRRGGLIGLTDSQSKWVQNYADELASDTPSDALARTLRDPRFDPIVLNAEEAGQKLSADQIDTMVKAYKNRALQYRAEAIARSETITALHEAQNQAMNQAVNSGAIDPAAVSYIWRATKDGRTRDSHRVMDGQKVAMGEMFITGDGNMLEYPGDPNGPPEEVINCRCWREPDIDFLYGVE